MTEKNYDISIHMDLGENGGVVAFRTVEDVKKWAEMEFDAWKFLSLSGKSDAPRAVSIMEIIERQMAVAENLMETARSCMGLKIPVADAESQFRRYLTDYAMVKAVHRDSVLGRMIQTMKDYSAMVLGMLAGAVGSATPDTGRLFPEDADVEAFTLGYALGLQFKIGSRPEIVSERLNDLESRLDSVTERSAKIDSTVKKSLEEHEYFSHKMRELTDGAAEDRKTLRRDYDAELTAARDDRLAVKDKCDAELKKIVDDAKDEIRRAKADFETEIRVVKDYNVKQLENIEEVCLKKMRLKPSIEYWMDMSRINTVKALQLTVWFGIIGLFGVGALMGVAFTLYKTGLLTSVAVSCSVMGLMVFIFVVLLSVLVKSRGLHEKAAIDAQRKVLTIETLESLENEGRLTADAKIAFVKDLMKDGDKIKAVSDKEKNPPAESK